MLLAQTSVRLDGFGTLVVAAVVWVVWRGILWLRGDRSVPRLVVVTVLFLWSLEVVRLTFFPMYVIFYDWHGTANLVPFASIIQILRETSSTTITDNLLGNVVLFVPFGILLPALFPELRRPTALLWRAAVISVAIETLQFVTQVRTVDVDDVILNTLGAMVGLALFTLVARVVGRSALERIGRRPEREPLLAAAVPVGVTLALVVPMMFMTIVSATLGGSDVERTSVEAAGGGSVVASTDVGRTRFVVAGTSSGAIARSDFERVIPGRYTWLGSTEPVVATGSHYGLSITAFNEARHERPVVVVWGQNRDGAAFATVTQGDSVTTLRLPESTAFVVGFEFDVYSAVEPDGVLTFDVGFRTSDGVDVTGRFTDSNA